MVYQLPKRVHVVVIVTGYEAHERPTLPNPSSNLPFVEGSESKPRERIWIRL